MKNTLFEESGCNQIDRLKKVIQEELSDLQRDVLLAYYFEKKKQVQIAQERKVNKSTISRTMKRAKENLRKFLQY